MSDYVGELHLRVAGFEDFDLRSVDFKDVNDCTVNALSDGTQWGNRESLTQVLTSMMRDGDHVTGVRYGNRKPTVNIVIEGPDLAAVARTEADLTKRVGRPAELRWQPADDFAELTVFDVVWSDLDHKMDDLGEKRLKRFFTLSFSALPHARPDALTITPALIVPEGAPDVDVVDAGTSLTGWTAFDEADSSGLWTTISQPAVVSGHVRITGTCGNYVGSPLESLTAPTVLVLQRWLAVDSDTHPYVTFRLRTITSTGSANTDGNFRVRIDSVDRTPISTTVTVDGYAELTYYVGAHSLTQIRCGATSLAPGGTAGFEVDSITMSTHPPESSSRRQLVRSVEVGGSARTQGSIKIDGKGDPLGDVLVMTWPKSLGMGYRPPLTPFRTGGSARTADGTLYSGGWATITASSIYQVPVAALPVAVAGDECPIWARMTIGGAFGSATIIVQARTYIGGSPIGDAITKTVTIDLEADTYKVVPLCHMPPMPTPIGPDGSVRFVITGTSTAGSVVLDELWLGPPGGAISVLNDAGTDFAWIDAPSLDKPFGAIEGSWAANRSDSHSVQAIAGSWELHNFDPEGVGMFTACNVLDALVSVEHYRRYHTHVAAED